jgi:hypothetical protein
MNQDDKSDAWKKGYAARSKVLGEAYVEKALPTPTTSRWTCRTT